MQVDELTQIYNRKFLDFQLKNRVSEAHEFNNKFELLFIDIDHFKNVNDIYGHDCGDGILRVVAQTITNNLRPDDLVGRWGGEEFIALVKTDSLTVLEEVAERLGMLVANSSFLYEEKVVRVTISIGGSIYDGNEKIESLIKRADQFMYLSKSTGRNKITIK